MLDWMPTHFAWSAKMGVAINGDTCGANMQRYWSAPFAAAHFGCRDAFIPAATESGVL